MNTNTCRRVRRSDHQHRCRPLSVLVWLALAAVVLLAVACTGESDAPSTETTEPASGTTDSTAEPEPGTDSGDGTAGESIELKPCAVRELECGTVTVPVDHADPDGETLEIAIGIHRATSPDDRIGYLLVNPGGPGGSGIDYAATATAGPGAAFTAEVIKHFDIVGFDPRGVAGSEPAFECGATGEQVGLLNTIDGVVDTDEEIAVGEQAAALCVKSMGSAAGFLGTESVVRDMDLIREALGAEEITYFGASYGSTVGVFYATLFPDRVRAMVVDGADNPVDDLSDQTVRIESSIEELQAFETLLAKALEACDSDACPIYNDGDPVGFYHEHIGSLGLVAESFEGDRSTALLAVVNPLYAEATWPNLYDGLAALADGDPQPLIDQATEQLLGGEPGAASFTSHVNCLDLWSLQPGFDRETQLGDQVAFNAAFSEALPLLAALPGIDATEPCLFYDTTVLIADPLPVALDGAGVPILVIGNRSDPATPFTESAELVDETLSDGHLVEVDHPQHVVYPGDDCVNEAVDAVLVDGSFPGGAKTDCLTGGDTADLGDNPTELELAAVVTAICVDLAGTDPDAALADIETACGVDLIVAVAAELSVPEVEAALVDKDPAAIDELFGLILTALDDAGIEASAE